MFMHRGLSELDLFYKIPLGPLPRDATQILVGLPHALSIDLGYVLQRGPARELIQVTHVNFTAHMPPFPMDVTRGFNGTAIEDHPADGWLVVVTPMPDFRTAEEKARDRAWLDRTTATCETCGAPDQLIGERCHYCIHVVRG